MNKGNIKIAGTEYKPASLKIINNSLSDDKSGRTEDGIMHVYWTRSKVVKLEVTMPPMKASELSSILSKIQGTTFSVTYFDIVTNAERTCTCYCAETSSECYSGVLFNGLWQNVTFNLIEV